MSFSDGRLGLLEESSGRFSPGSEAVGVTEESGRRRFARLTNG